MDDKTLIKEFIKDIKDSKEVKELIKNGHTFAIWQDKNEMIHCFIKEKFNENK